MTTRNAVPQIAFRYRPSDSNAGVSRKTVKRLAAYLGMDETQTIHRALRDLSVRVLPQYEADDGALTDDQIAQIRQQVPQKTLRSVRSSLLDTETA